MIISNPNVVKVLMLAAASRILVKRSWLLDALTVTNEKETEFTVDGNVALNTEFNLTKAQCNKPSHGFALGEIVGINKSFTAAVVDNQAGDGEDEIRVYVIGKSSEPILHRLDVFKPSDNPAIVKEALGVNVFTNSLITSGKTTVGRFIENLICLQYPTNYKVFNYMNEVIDPGKLVDKVTNAMTTKKITVDQYKQFLDNFFYLNHITEICVPSMTERSLMTNPKVAEAKKRFIEEHKDQMTDPIVIKQLEDELIALDKEWLGRGTDNEDPSVTFFDGLGGKSYALHRKKLFLTTGGIPAFDESSGKFDFIPNSLSEGWTVQALPSIANEIRKGSYERGKETAKGGAETKLVMRVFQDLMVSKDDCGTKRTIKADFKNLFRVKDFIGRTVRWHGADTIITEDNMKQFEGQVVDLYSPMTCENPYDLCYKCCGQKAKELGGKVIGIQVVKITSKFMNTAMKNMHGTVLQVIQPKLEDIFL